MTQEEKVWVVIVFAAFLAGILLGLALCLQLS